MKHCGIVSQEPGRTWIDEVTFNNLLVSLLDSIFIYYDTKIILAFAAEISIHIQIRWVAVVSILNNICVSAEET